MSLLHRTHSLLAIPPPQARPPTRKSLSLTSSPSQALRVPLITTLARAPRTASRRPRPALPTALRVLGRTRATATTRGRRSRRPQRRRRARGRGGGRAGRHAAAGPAAEQVQDRGVGGLGLVVAVEEEGVLACTPAVRREGSLAQISLPAGPTYSVKG